MTTTIYTLKLENEKYYVGYVGNQSFRHNLLLWSQGKSNAPEKRILEHFEEEGSEWTSGN